MIAKFKADGARLCESALPDQRTFFRAAYTIGEVCAVSSLGRTTIYGAIKAGLLVARKAGRRTVVTHTDLKKFLDDLPKAGGQ